MLASSTNFAFGFFGWPLDGKFLQEVTIESTGVSSQCLYDDSVLTMFLVQQYTGSIHHLRKFQRGYSWLSWDDLYAEVDRCLSQGC